MRELENVTLLRRYEIGAKQPQLTSASATVLPWIFPRSFFCDASFYFQSNLFFESRRNFYFILNFLGEQNHTRGNTHYIYHDLSRCQHRRMMRNTSNHRKMLQRIDSDDKVSVILTRVVQIQGEITIVVGYSSTGPPPEGQSLLSSLPSCALTICPCTTHRHSHHYQSLSTSLPSGVHMTSP